MEMNGNAESAAATTPSNASAPPAADSNSPASESATAASKSTRGKTQKTLYRYPPGDPRNDAVAHDRIGNAWLSTTSPSLQVISADIRSHYDLSVWSSFARFGKAFGSGYFYYFDFLRFLLAVNLILFVFAFSNWITHVRHDGFLSSGNFSGFGFRYNFYVASYSHSDYHTWVVTNSLALVFAGVAAPLLYLLGVWWWMRQRRHQEYDGFMISNDTDFIEANRDVSVLSRVVRVKIGAWIMAAAVAVMLLVNLGIVIFEENYAASGNTTLEIVSLLVLYVCISPQGGLEEMLLVEIATAVARFTRPARYSELRRRQITYNFLIRNLNLAFLLFSQWLVVRYPAVFIETAYESQDRKLLAKCGLLWLGDFYLAFMFVALIVMPPINAFLYPVLGRYLFPWLERMFLPPLRTVTERCFPGLWSRYDRAKERSQKKLQQRLEEGDPCARWGSFVVSNEYTDALYRQFLVLVGMPVFPFITALAVLACLLDVFMVKLRLLRFHHRPPPLEGSQKTLLVVLMFVTALMALATFPAGAAFLFPGLEYRNYCPGVLWTSGPNQLQSTSK